MNYEDSYRWIAGRYDAQEYEDRADDIMDDADAIGVRLNEDAVKDFLGGMVAEGEDPFAEEKGARE
jgi:hypothetical protein